MSKKLSMIAEDLYEIGLRYATEIEGEMFWKVNPKCFMRSQIIRGRHIVTFIRDFIHQDLAIYLGDLPGLGPIAVVSMKDVLESETDIPRSRQWTHIEHEIVDDYFKMQARVSKGRIRTRRIRVKRRKQRIPLVTLIEDGSVLPVDVSSK